MPSINVSSFNAISNTNSRLLNFCVPAQTAVIQTGYCTCGRDAGNTAGNTAGTLAGNSATFTSIVVPACSNFANAQNTFTSSACVVYSNTTYQSNFNKLASCCLQIEPWCCVYWSAIPSLVSSVCTLTICNITSPQCGQCCAWTVPSGATFVRFELWGAGAGSHNICCCGFNMWGGSGAYASVIIPAVVGCSYTVCAGCAYMCSMTEAGINAGPGVASYVTGFGLSNFCADGGESSQYVWQMRVKNCCSVFAGVCAGMNMVNGFNKVNKGTTYGCCICSGGGACFGGTCDYDLYPFSTSCKTWYGSVTNATNSCHYVIGTPGVFNCVSGISGSLSTPGQCRYWIAPPITCQTCATCQLLLNMQQCCSATIYHGCCSSYAYAPGVGGRPSSACGGQGNAGGGIAVGGQVRITYTTTT